MLTCGSAVTQRCILSTELRYVALIVHVVI